MNDEEEFLHKLADEYKCLDCKSWFYCEPSKSRTMYTLCPDCLLVWISKQILVNSNKMIAEAMSTTKN